MTNLFNGLLLTRSTTLGEVFDAANLADFSQAYATDKVKPLADDVPGSSFRSVDSSLVGSNAGADAPTQAAAQAPVVVPPGYVDISAALGSVNPVLIPIPASYTGGAPEAEADSGLEELDAYPGAKVAPAGLTPNSIESPSN